MTKGGIVIAVHRCTVDLNGYAPNHLISLTIANSLNRVCVVMASLLGCVPCGPGSIPGMPSNSIPHRVIAVERFI